MDIQPFNMVSNSYVREFPGKSGWETAAVGILLSYERACSENPNKCDLLKYGVMHAFRWGRSTNSCPIFEPKAPLSDPFLQACTSIRQLGNEFVGVFGCHKRHMAGVFHLEESQEDHLRYCCDPNWFAFEYLDEVLAKRDVPTDVDAQGLAEKMLGEILKNLKPCADLSSFFRSCVNLFQKHRSAAHQVYRTPIEAPSEWTYRGATLAQFQRVWDSLGLLAFAHMRAAVQCQYSENDPRKLILWKRSDLLAFLSETSGEQSATQVALESMIYCRDLSPPDISLQPFVEINAEWIVASPWMVATSNFSRNFFALIARRDSTSWNSTSNIFADHMGNQLSNWINDLGYRATTQVNITDDNGNELTDFDLVVWSPEEHFVITAELKWMIQVADLMEVLNRGEKECLQKLREQLPKHRQALATDTAGVIHRAFNEHANVDTHDSLLVCQGFGGTPRLPSEFPCVDERVFRLAIEHSGTLREAMAWLRSREWLPRVREHFRVNDMTIRTTIGIRLTFPEPEFPT